jgi:hypothetical protein
VVIQRFQKLAVDPVKSAACWQLDRTKKLFQQNARPQNGII